MSLEKTPANISLFDWQEMKRQQEQNTQAIGALIRAVDSQRVSTDNRLSAVEKQLAALVESNKLLAELITSRLPARPETNNN
jgi:hypothetical protein